MLYQKGVSFLSFGQKRSKFSIRDRGQETGTFDHLAGLIQLWLHPHEFDVVAWRVISPRKTDDLFKFTRCPGEFFLIGVKRPEG